MSKEFLEKCDKTIKDAMHNYNPSSMWEDAAAPVHDDHAQLARISPQTLLDEMEDPHAKSFGIVKVMQDLRKQIMWGMTGHEAIQALKALTQRRTQYQYELVVHK